ncbi:MAG: BtpA/SgcQ family protein [Synechococcaceae cyanobacterium]|nr:BtpA/SgcQ family protein [Synechococcaceae cyanobacterium]
MALSPRWRALFPGACPLIGVVHLPPLPGSPGWGGDLAAVERFALADAAAYREAGADGLIVENLGDAPYFPGPVPPETVAAMARLTRAVVAAAGDLPVGVNVLRNDALAALAVAVAAGARFLRVNVLTGATVTDQGLIEGCAAALLRRRRLLEAAEVLILADVLVKHGAPLAPLGLEEAVRDTLARGGADGVIVSGAGTGRPTAAKDLEQARAEVARLGAGAPVLVGSGVAPAVAPGLLGCCDGMIVGSALKREGVLDRPVDPERVRALRRLLPQSPQRSPAP